MFLTYAYGLAVNVDNMSQYTGIEPNQGMGAC
jgi:hypothetical protein